MKNIMFAVVRFFLHIFYIFPVKKNKIFFLSSKETGFGYDCKALAEYCMNNYPDKYILMWGIYDISRFENMNMDKINLVKMRSLFGVYHIMTSKAVIYNVNAPFYIPYRKQQSLFNTWHGNPYKKIGKDANDFFNKSQVNFTDYFLSHSKRYDGIIRGAFEYHGKILRCGVPRNDCLFNKDSSRLQEIRNKFRKCENKKIVLYAPTYRSDLTINNRINANSVVNALKETFGGEWIVFIRMHPKVTDNICDSNEQINVTSYPDMQDLLYISDVLITDYSSTLWDFALTGKPIFIFAPDINEYSKSRGLYDDYFDLPFPFSENEPELIENIREFDTLKYSYNLTKHIEEQESYEQGKACETIMKILNAQRRI